MLDGHSPNWAHLVQNVTLILLSVCFIPVDCTVLCLSYVFGAWRRSHIAWRRADSHASRDHRSYRVLVTGVGMTKGLTLARLFHRSGHHVVGADFDPNACGRMSNCVAKYYRLRPPSIENGSLPYVESLLEIIMKEKIDVWVSCSGVASAAEDGEAMEVVRERTNCQTIQFNVKMTTTLHEKSNFINYVRDLGLTTPDTHVVESIEMAESALRDAPANNKYIMKPIGMDDAARGDMTLLPMQTSEQTHRHISRLRPSKRNPFILQEFVQGSEYCTHALVVRGEVKAFVACPSAELLMYYEALPSESALSQAMLRFTSTLASKSGDDFTGHLSFDFLVKDTSPSNPDDIFLYPIECNPRAHTAVVLFSETSSMVDAYLSVFSARDTRKPTGDVVVIPATRRKYFWLGHDIVTLLAAHGPPGAYRGVIHRLMKWHDGTFELADPLPWFWLYHVFWPSQFLRCILSGTRWSRINVSTGKMFTC